MKKILTTCFFIFSIFTLAGCDSNTYISLDDAKKEALKQFNGDVVGFEKTLEGDNPNYTITIEQEGKRYEVIVDAKEGKIIDHKMLDDQNNNSNNDMNGDSTFDPNSGTNSDANSGANTGTNNGIQENKKIGEEEAKKTALTEVGQGDVTNCSLQDYHGTEVYVVEVLVNNVEYLVHVDPIKNTVLNTSNVVID